MFWNDSWGPLSYNRNYNNDPEQRKCSELLQKTSTAMDFVRHEHIGNAISDTYSNLFRLRLTDDHLIRNSVHYLRWSTLCKKRTNEEYRIQYMILSISSSIHFNISMHTLHYICQNYSILDDLFQFRNKIHNNEKNHIQFMCMVWQCLIECFQWVIVMPLFANFAPFWERKKTQRFWECELLSMQGQIGWWMKKKKLTLKQPLTKSNLNMKYKCT